MTKFIVLTLIITCVHSSLLSKNLKLWNDYNLLFSTKNLKLWDDYNLLISTKNNVSIPVVLEKNIFFRCNKTHDPNNVRIFIYHHDASKDFNFCHNVKRDGPIHISAPFSTFSTDSRLFGTQLLTYKKFMDTHSVWSYMSYNVKNLFKTCFDSNNFKHDQEIQKIVQMYQDGNKKCIKNSKTKTDYIFVELILTSILLIITTFDIIIIGHIVYLVIDVFLITHQYRILPPDHRN